MSAFPAAPRRLVPRPRAALSMRGPSRTIGAMREHVDAVLLDFDGTLFDTAPDLIAALNRTLSELGHAPVPFDDFRQRAGAGAKRLLLAALAAQGAERPDDATLRPLIQQLIAHYFEIETERIRPFPAVVATIERLREAGVSLAVCTNRGERSTRRLLAHFAIDRHIEAVLAGDTVERMKPDPGHVREALAALGAEPERAVMVGDSAADVDSAQGAGVAAIVTAYGYSPTPPHDLGADAVIDDFAELPASIERLFPR